MHRKRGHARSRTPAATPEPPGDARLNEERRRGLPLLRSSLSLSSWDRERERKTERERERDTERERGGGAGGVDERLLSHTHEMCSCKGRDGGRGRDGERVGGRWAEMKREVGMSKRKWQRE